MNYDRRDIDLQLSNDKFLKICQISFLKNSGPGGQKINKTSSAVRLIHIPTLITSQASKSRQQNINRLLAIRKLRLSLAESIRLPQKSWQEKWELNEKNPLFPLFVAFILDSLYSSNWIISKSAQFFQLSTNQFSKICIRHKNLHTIINHNRLKLQLSPLK